MKRTYVVIDGELREKREQKIELDAWFYLPTPAIPPDVLRMLGALSSHEDLGVLDPIVPEKGNGSELPL
jgi:hypothetical protein